MKNGLIIALAAILMIIIAFIAVFVYNRKYLIMDGPGMVQTFKYKSISQEEAREMMARDDGHVIVDVRRTDEYAEGHIPGAILIPNESITDTPPAELSDYNQIILVYCRSGRRSKEAAQKLADMGFPNIYEFGGIIDWTGEIEKPADNTGKIDEPASVETENMDPMPVVQVVTGDTFFTINLEDNSSAEEFLDKLKKDALTIKMSDFGGFEKVGDLPWSITTNDTEITTEPGDLILYQGDKITIYYGENTWNFTKLGRLNAEPEEIVAAFGGEEDITAEFSVEWTE